MKIIIGRIALWISEKLKTVIIWAGSFSPVTGPSGTSYFDLFGDVNRPVFLQREFAVEVAEKRLRALSAKPGKLRFDSKVPAMPKPADDDPAWDV